MAPFTVWHPSVVTLRPEYLVADRVPEVERDASERVHHGLEPGKFATTTWLIGMPKFCWMVFTSTARPGVERRIDPVRAARSRYRDIGVAWDREHLDLVRLRHEPQHDDHVRALAGLGERVAERGGLAGVADERPGVGADEKDVDRVRRRSPE